MATIGRVRLGRNDHSGSGTVYSCPADKWAIATVKASSNSNQTMNLSVGGSTAIFAQVGNSIVIPPGASLTSVPTITVAVDEFAAATVTT